MPEKKPSVVGVRRGNAAKIEYFHSGGMPLEAGDYVVIQTARGPEIARVVVAPDQVIVDEIDDSDLKPILRRATGDDLAKADDLKQRAKELLGEARTIAGEAGFPARLDDAEFTLDGKRLKVTFSHDSRVEYRETARKLSSALGVRVDMSQLGARDRARLAGGYGICGRELCCANWLATFPAISIRMAKEQELPLNPEKISGLCGRLLCCLSYEDEGYREMRKTLPKLGQRCSTPTGEGKVVAVNVLQRKVTLLVEGQRVEVGDRDLGLVVRWDPSSKSAPPPPSLTTAEAVAEGLLTQEEADERDRENEEKEPLAAVLAGAGGQGRNGNNRSTQPSPRRGAGREAAASGAPRRARRRGGRSRARSAKEPSAAPLDLQGAKSRTFRRAGSAVAGEGGETQQGGGRASTPAAGNEKAKPKRGRRRRGRRRGRSGNGGS